MNKKYTVFLIVVVLGIILLVFLSSKKEKIPGNNPATVSTLSVTNVTSSAGVLLAGAKNINWQTANYPVDAGVNINLIKKTSDSPIEFTLVRTLEVDTPNDGEYLWMPQDGDNFDDLYIEVTCSDNYLFQAGCSLLSDPIKVN